MTKFHSDKTKQDCFFNALRGDPKNLPTKTTLAKKELTDEKVGADYKFGTIINNRKKNVFEYSKSTKRMKKMAVSSAMDLPPGVYFKSMNTDEDDEVDIGRSYQLKA